MGFESTPLLRPGQYRLRALMAATAVVGVLLALGRWAGVNRPGARPRDSATGRVLDRVGLGARSHGPGYDDSVRGPPASSPRLFCSMEAMTLLGGVSMLTSGFFRYWPWAGLGLYGCLTWNPSLSGQPMFLAAWPMAYGAITTGLSTIAIVAERTISCRWRWTVAAAFLGILALAEAAVLSWHGAWWPDLSACITALVTYCLELASLAAAVGFVRDGDRKIWVINLIATAFLLPSLLPSVIVAGVAVPPQDLIWSMGPGYWLLALGAR